MATPHVAGVAGLLWMYFPECTNQQIRNVLSASAKKINDDESCNINTGYGLVQAIDAYVILDQGGCGGYANITTAKGGCEQLDTYSLSCTTDSDCDDGDPCTVDSCSAEGTCTTSMDCSQCQKDGLVTINIVTDAYPSETTWDIKTGSTAYTSGGPYAEMMLYTTYVCLSAGSYTFTIHDEIGDGVCCEQGNGSYNLTLDDTVLITGGSFGASEATAIDVTASTTSPSSALTNEPSQSPSNAPSLNPSNAPSLQAKNEPTKKPTKNARTKLRKKITKDEKIIIKDETEETVTKKKSFKSLEDIRKHMKKMSKQMSEDEISNNIRAKKGKTSSAKEGKDSKKKKKSNKKKSKKKKKPKKL